MKTFFAAVFLFSMSVQAAEISREQVLESMEKATKFMMSIATEGGYLWKYSSDLSVRAGENMASPTQIWIQTPGTPAMGQAFLTAYGATKDSLFLEAARQAAEALVKCQLPSGGWYYAGDFNPDKPNIDGLRSHAGDQAAAKNPQAANPLYLIGTCYDDKTTQGAIRFLMDYVDAAKDSGNPRDRSIGEALNKALEGMLRAQYPNGAWPQFYDGKPRNEADFPVKPASMPRDYPRVSPHVDYRSYYTLNDSSLSNCIQVMFEAHRRYGDPVYLESAKRGLDFVLLAQLPEPQAGWAQQYTPDMVPAWGRIFEPPSVVSNESRDVMELLMEMYLKTDDRRYFDAVGRAAAWLRQSSLAPDRWARFYELNSNKPIYCTPDGTVIYDLEGARPGYNWQNDFHIPACLARYDAIKKMGREAWLAEKNSATKPPEKAADLEKKAAAILEQLDGQGRWIVKDRFRKNLPDQDMISTEAFIDNMRVLSKYLELTQQANP